MSKESKKSLLFPRFLIPQPRKTPQSPPPPSSPPSSPDKNKYLNGHTSYLRCSTCAVDLCLTTQIISKGFTGRHGRAYLVSGESSSSAEPAVSVSASSSTTASLPNTLLQRPVPRQLVTGAHTVSDICCNFCGTVLGWKYVAAEEESQRYKVGKFILETKKIMGTSCWEGLEGETEAETEVKLKQKPGTQAQAQVQVQRGLGEREERDVAEVEFDSQDEDECEDLFAGIWSSGLASRRRSRKVERKPTVFGFS